MWKDRIFIIVMAVSLCSLGAFGTLMALGPANHQVTTADIKLLDDKGNGQITYDDVGYDEIQGGITVYLTGRKLVHYGSYVIYD